MVRNFFLKTSASPESGLCKSSGLCQFSEQGKPSEQGKSSEQGLSPVLKLRTYTRPKTTAESNQAAEFFKVSPRSNAGYLGSKFLLVALSASAAMLLQSCAMKSTHNRHFDSSMALKPSSGTILTVAGPISAPEISSDGKLAAKKMFGLTGGSFGKELLISLGGKTAKLVENGSVVMESALLDFESLEAGSYQVTLKQKDPLWYAPDSYFEERQLPVPASGEKDRYLRGAFGSYALFLGDEKVLHAGDYALKEVPGMRLDENAVGKIFSTLESGDSITITN